ncbi:MAG TPA: hypothetical protein ENI38_02835, partial [Candidatus Acetothermia bacterium]|nr:hypothetical protein [Candidatus Acetothermia bacterium]
MAKTGQEIWNRVKGRLAEELPPSTFASWFSGINAKALDGELLVLEAPSGYVKAGVERKYRALLERLVTEAAGRPLRVKLEVAAQLPPSPP